MVHEADVFVKLVEHYVCGGWGARPFSCFGIPLVRVEGSGNTGLADEVLSLVFQQYHDNLEIKHILTKVVLLNGLYNTNVFAVVDMAYNIQEQSPDDLLRNGSAEVVDKIAHLTIRGKTRRHYSFATKYCSWHYPEMYPIYDNLVERLIWNYRKQFNFEIFQRSDLVNYERYRNILRSFISYFSLQDFTFKEIDRFLWSYAKELYKG